MYLIVEHGWPHVEDRLPKYKPSRYAVISRFWEKITAFDAESEYRLRVTQVPAYSWWSRALARSIYNPRVALQHRWEQVSPYSPARIVDLVESALSTDDDVIQQWFEASDVLRLLREASDFSEILLAVRAICGEHEEDAGVSAYVHRVIQSDA